MWKWEKTPWCDRRRRLSLDLLLCWRGGRGAPEIRAFLQSSFSERALFGNIFLYNMHVYKNVLQCLNTFQKHLWYHHHFVMFTVHHHFLNRNLCLFAGEREVNLVSLTFMNSDISELPEVFGLSLSCCCCLLKLSNVGNCLLLVRRSSFLVDLETLLDV